MELSGFGASKKRRLNPSRQGGVLTGGRKRWCRMKNPPVRGEGTGKKMIEGVH
jgi:hypothetical protein